MAEEEAKNALATEEEQANKDAGPQNTVTIEQAGPCKKKVIIEIPPEKIKKATDEQYRELGRDAIVPGFRKGRAPRRLLEKRFGKDISEQIKLKLLSEASDSAIKDNKLSILGEPDVKFETVTLPSEGALKFDFEVEVMPEFELPALEGIEVKRAKLEATDEHIDKEIERIQQLYGLWTPREGGSVKLNDQVIADVVIRVEGSEQEEKLSDIEIYVRTSGFVGSIPVEKLDELLVGAKAGDTKETDVDVSKTFFREEYRGKKIHLKIEAKDIKWLKAADLDQNLFDRFEVKNVDELREKTRDRLQNELEQRIRSEMTEQIHRYLLDNTEFDLPLDLVADQATTVLRRLYTNLLIRGLSREQIEEQMEHLKASSEEQAKQQLKTFFVMDKVADKLGITVGEEEINGYIAQLAMSRGQRPERLREQMERDGSLAQFKLEVRTDKCVAKLLESAKITEVEPVKAKTKKATKAKATEKSEKEPEQEQDKPVKKPAKKRKAKDE